MANIERIKNIKTTVMGVIIFVLGCVMFAIGKIDVWGFIPVVLLSYSLIMAKDTLLEGITLGIFKNKDNGTNGKGEV